MQKTRSQRKRTLFKIVTSVLQSLESFAVTILKRFLSMRSVLSKVCYSSVRNFSALCWLISVGRCTVAEKATDWLSNRRYSSRWYGLPHKYQPTCFRHSMFWWFMGGSSQFESNILTKNHVFRFAGANNRSVVVFEQAARVPTKYSCHFVYRS